MGAKQSKRSVDISGKEAESGGEVAAAGAGGEGRVEPLADADALKPQLNGDAHIQTEQTEKEKVLDSGTPENEKDATTEKEDKEEKDKDTEVAPVTNGEAEEKLENGESTPTPTPEDGKKPKKEKVKKKWSLRSISFSRKDKPKQEKKQKDEEAKTNGEPEKVPEETAEATAATESAAEEVAAEASAVEVVEEQTAETPVTEPLTNGTGASSPSPDSPAEEAPAPVLEADKPAPAPAPAPAPLPEPEQLPVNGLSLEESKPEVPEEKAEETKPDPPAAETVEIAPAPEIPVKEVCVQQMPLLESTPPPLPANPPPSSVASFAATTMAPELSAASIPNTADTALEPLKALPDTNSTIDQINTQPPASESNATELPSPLKETSEDIPVVVDAIDSELPTELTLETRKAIEPVVQIEVEAVPTTEQVAVEEMKEQFDEIADFTEAITERIPACDLAIESSPEPKIEQIHEPEMTISEIDDAPLPPPPAQDDIEVEANLEKVKQNCKDDITDIPEPITETEEIKEADHAPEQELTNGVDEISLVENSVTAAENAKNKAKAVTENGVDKIEYNGEAGDSEVITIDLTKNEVADFEVTCKKVESGVAESSPSAESPPPPPAAPAPAPEPIARTPQEPVSVSDKLADLIPEVPDVPEINTETLQETATDVAVAN